MRTQPRQFVLFLALLLFAAVASCRVPDAPIVRDPAVGYIYDPKTADAIAARFSASPETKALNDRYRTALAEPVSVVAWEEDHSVSKIFYATNRVPQFASDGRVQFGSPWSVPVAVGTCEVTLPKRQRGVEVAQVPPKSENRLAAWFTGGKKETVAPASAPTENAAAMASRVSVDAPRLIAAPEYFAEMRQTVQQSPEKDVLIFVHGFNVDFASCVTRAAQVAIDLPFNGAVVAYSWPSQGGIGNYNADEQIVSQSVGSFVHYLDQLEQALPPESKIHILVHSMGNRLVLHGLSQLPARFRQPARISNLVLAAPDVGVHDFAMLAPQVVATARRVTLYTNLSDTALIVSKGKNQQQRIGDAFPPVVVAGVETIDASRIETGFMGHSYYGSNRAALSDLFALIKENRGAADRPWLRMESATADADYKGVSLVNSWWVFNSQPAEIRWVWHFDRLKQVNGSAVRTAHK